MRLRRMIIVAGAAISFMIVGNCLATVPTSGKDGKVEWLEVGKIELPDNPVDIARTLDGKLSFILTDKAKVLIYDERGVLQGSIPVDAGVTGIDIDPQGNYMYLIDSSQKITSTIAVGIVVEINTENAPYKGDVNAPVTIAVFSDFQ